jgi:hypothetical protein
VKIAQYQKAIMQYIPVIFLNIIAFLCVFVAHTSAQFSNVGASACSQIIQAGIYNTFSTSSGQSSYATFQSTMCSDLSGYTYDEYSSQIGSTQANSEAVNVNAAASYFGIGGSVGVDTSKSSLSQTQFNTFKSTQSAYRQTACGSSSSSNGFSDSVNSVSNVIDPSISASYTSCLKIYATGIQITQTTGVGSQSLSLDIQFVTNNLGAKAYMTGISFNGPATCKLKGPSLPKGATSTFQFKLIVDAVYTIVCQLQFSVKADGKITDIYLSTTPGGTYHALLFHSVPADQVTALQSQLVSIKTLLGSFASSTAVAALSTQLNTANTQITNTNAQLATLSTQVTSIGNKQDYTILGPASYVVSLNTQPYPGGYVSMLWPYATDGGNHEYDLYALTKQYGYTVPYKGSLVGISCTAGTPGGASGQAYAVQVFVNGVLLVESPNFSIVDTAGSGSQQSQQSSVPYSEGTYNFNKGDVISVYINFSYIDIELNSFAWLTLGYAH